METILSAPGSPLGKGFAELHQARIDTALQQELRVLVDAVVVHAAARMAAVLVAQVELVVLWHEAEFEDAGVQCLVPAPCAALAAIGAEEIDRHAQRHAGLAAIAVGAVSEHAAAPEAVGHQVRISVVVDQVAGCGDLRAGLFARQVAAGIRCRCIKLQGLQGQVFEVRHGRSGIPVVRS
jgi:hypothetical protein